LAQVDRIQVALLLLPVARFVGSVGFAVNIMAAPPVDANYHIYVYGKIHDPVFQMYRVAAEYLASERRNIQCTVQGYYESQYEQQLRYIIGQFGGSFAQSKPSAALIYAETDDSVLYFANDKRFMEWAAKRFKYEDNTRIIFYKRVANKALSAQKAKSGRAHCSIGFQVADDMQETVSIELFTDACPTLTSNFLKLIDSPKFNGHILHRVKAGAWVQAGDLVDGSGSHSEAADGGVLRTESSILHDRPGLLGMACNGKDTNGSQFYITMRELPFMDGKSVIIGRVTSGMRTILKISKLETRNERPVKDVKVGKAAAEAAFVPKGKPKK